jgi:hypothetical protein
LISPGGADRWVLTNAVNLLPSVVIPMPYVLPHREEVAVAVEPIVAQKGGNGYSSAILGFVRVYKIGMAMGINLNHRSSLPEGEGGWASEQSLHIVTWDGPFLSP